MYLFNLQESKQFKKEFKNFDRKTQEKINNTILEEIQTNPKNFPLMKYEYAGLRESKIVGTLRLLFAICDECRELRNNLKKCIDCNEIEQNTIKLLSVFYHKHKYPKIF
jgi:mRNA-degrading endonuclease YafQ of YafQ-DinJ toxin-antitoxin module